jgi:hypothetical protein
MAILSMEKRKENTAKPIPAGSILCPQFVDQANAAMSRSRFRIQYVANDDNVARDLRDRLSSPPDDIINFVRELIADGRIDATQRASYLPRWNGMRLSAIYGKHPRENITDLKGNPRRRWAPEQTNLDVMFNDSYHGRFRRIPNVDRPVNRLMYPIKTGLAQGFNWMLRLPPAQFVGNRVWGRPIRPITPQRRTLPSEAVNIYDHLVTDSKDKYAVRYTATHSILPTPWGNLEARAGAKVGGEDTGGD